MRRHLGVVLILIVLVLPYIAPANLMPSSAPSAIVQEPQEDKDFIVSADYDVEMATDGDDSFWYNVSVWDNRFGNENNLCRNRSGDVAVVYMRWQVNVPKDATINSANFSIYVWSENDQSHTVRRIIEANVSPDMESRGDFEFPNITLTNEVGFTADTASQYELINITDMMQDQVDLSGWASGQYFGVGIVGSQTAPTEFRDREANDYNAYLNISYTEGAGEDPIEDPPEQDYDYTIQEFVAADSDDTTWKLTLPSTWSDNDSLTEVVTTNSSGSFYRYGLMRFQLDIPAGCTVNYATVSMYLINNGNESVTIQRIDEVNVGDLEADTSKPDSTSLHSGSFFGGPATGWVTSGNIAEMIQDAIDTDGWATNNYFGVEMSISSPESSSSVGWNDYQLGSNPAYLNVTYTNTTVGWLSGWQYRKKYVSDQMNGGDVNRTIPVFLYEGTGSDGGYIGRLNDNANNDFSDVRFTSDNGTLLIKYYHNQTVTGTSEDHFMEDGVGFPWGATNTPAAYYDSDTDRTYVAFQGDLAPAGDDLDPHICYYDHQTASWSGIYWIAENPLNEWQGGDSHGAPSLWIDNNGYIHVLFGAHASQVIQHVVSDNPNDITSFSAATDPTTGTWEPTYPAVHYDSTNDVVHLFYRGSTGGRYLVYQNSTDNGDTWNSEQAIVYMGTTQGMHNRPYHGFNAFSDNEIIHIAFQNHSMWPSAGSGGDRDMFYIQFNVTNGRVYNITGSDFGTQASPTEIQDARFYEYPLENGTRSGYPDVFLDDDGNPWIFYYVGDTQLEYNNDYTELQGNPSDFTLRYSYWNSTSSAWQSANITAATSHEGSGPCAAALVWTDSNITIWSNTDKTTNLVHRWTWDGSSWTHQGSISVTASYLVSNPIVPTNYADGNRTEFQVAFNEFEGANPPFEKCMGWAWGSGGLLSRTEQDLAKFNVMIVGNFTTSAQTIYVYYGRSDATSKSGTFSLSGPPDPSPLWWGPQTENVDYFDFVDQVSNEDGVADIGTHSNFANQQAGPDAVYDTLSEVDVSTGGYYETDYFDGWASNIDGIADIGTDSSQSNAQAGPDSSYMNVQEGNEGGGTTTTEYIAEAFTDVGGDFGSESNAYDGDWGTYATDTIFSNADDYPSAYASGFDSGASGSGTITQVDIVIRMSFSSSSASDSWGITLDVSASTNNELRAHDDQPYSLNNLTFTDVTEPNGGGWSWAEVQAIEVHLDGEKVGGRDNDVWNVYEFAVKVSTSVPDDYELDLEYDWSSANVTPTYHNVCIYIQTAIQSTENLKAWEWNSAGGDWVSLGDIDSDGWNNFTASYVTSSSYYIKLNDSDQSGDTTQNNWNIDCIILYSWTPPTAQYQIEIEEQWTSAFYVYDNEYLCIYMGTVGAENLSVEVWHDSSWNQITDHLNGSSWNNISVHSWLISSEFTIRFKGTNETILDNGTLDTWQKDVVLLWTYPSLSEAPEVALPYVDNADDTNNLYAHRRDYQLIVNVTDANGASDIDYVNFTLLSNDRVTEYWALLYNQTGSSWTEYDTSGYITFDSSSSDATASGVALDLTFIIEVDWDHPDVLSTDSSVFAIDNNNDNVTEFDEFNYDFETRLDMSSGPTLNDGSGTADRGDIDGSITGSGTVIYYGGTANPLAAEIDMWISATEYGTQTGPWNATNLANDGTFSHTVYADDVIGLDTFTFKAVIQAAGSGGADLMQTTQQDTYIADRLNITIEADSETPEANQQVNFTLTVQYDYDDTTCTTYTVQIARNLTAWYEFTNSNKSLFNDTNAGTTYNYTAISDSTDSTHGLTEFITNLVTVTWEAALQTVLINELLELFDSTTPAQTLALTVNELIPLAESVGTTMILAITILEIIGLAAVVSTEQIATVSISEVIGFDSVVSTTVNLSTSINELIAFSDSQQLAMSLGQTVYEILPFSESVNTTSVTTVYIGEVIGLSDTISTVLSGAVTINEVIGLSDTITTVLSGAVTINEVIDLFDSVTTALGGEYFVTVYELIDLTSITETAISQAITINELIDLSETISTAMSVFVTINDVINLYDSVVPVMGSYVTVSESLPLADTISTVLNGAVAINELIDLSETISTTVFLVVTITETIPFFDHVTAEIPIFSIVLNEIIPIGSHVTVSGVPSAEEEGFFYELFLSLEMWGYLGPLGLVIGGYIVINKNRNLGIIWFVVECLFIAQYLTLVSATPQYWWHIYILLLGGMFTITYPLWGGRRR